MQIAFWLFVLMSVMAITAFHGYVQVVIWARWTKVNLEGAGRSIFVGISGWSDEGFVYPNPQNGNDRAHGGNAGGNTFFVHPLMKTVAFVDTDRDELRVLIPISPEGAPASPAEGDEATVLMRVSWSIAEWIVFHDVPDAPGDHGKLPRNLRVPWYDVPRDVYQGALKRHEGDNVPIDFFYPGWAAVAFMQEYTKGEHIRRIVEFLTEHVREFYGAYSVRELMRVADEGKKGSLPLRYLQARVRGNTLPVPQTLQDQFRVMETRGEFQQAVSEIVGWAGRVELEPYGIFPNDITEVRLTLPKSLVDASRAREARGEDVRSMEALTSQLKKSVTDLNQTGMTPDVSGLIAADSVGTTSRPGPLALLAAGLKIFQKSGGA